MSQLAQVRAPHGNSGGDLECWKLFAGGGVTSKAAQDIAAFWNDKYSVHVNIRTSLFAERGDDKFGMLHDQHPSVKTGVKECADVVDSCVSNKFDENNRCMLGPCGSLDG